MNYLCGVASVVFLVIASITALAPDIQIYEVRENANNGIRLHKVKSQPNYQQKVINELLRLLSPKRQIFKQNSLNNQFNEQLKRLKGGGRNIIANDPHIYILDINSYNDKSSSEEDTFFLDETRNERPKNQRTGNILDKFLPLRRNDKFLKIGKNGLRSGDFNEDRVHSTLSWDSNDGSSD